MQHHNAGRLPEAERIYQQILQADPNQPDAMHLLGVIALQVGKYGPAIELITRALTIQPTLPSAHYNLGNALKASGRLEDAFANYQQAIDQYPSFAPAHNNLGLTCLALGRQKDAVDSYQRALACKPDYAEAHFNLGYALNDLGRLDDAVASYRLAIAHKSNYAKAYSNLGLTLEDQKQVDDAISCYKDAIAIQPDATEPRFNLIVLLERVNRIEEMREALGKARRNCQDDPRLDYCEALLHKRDGDCKAARKLIEKTVGQDVDTQLATKMAYLLGEVCDRLGDTDAAFSYFLEANNSHKASDEAMNCDGGRHRAELDRSVERFTTDWVKGWNHIEPNDGRPDPVFLVGFLRSGTTLLDNILHSHPTITVMEEKPVVMELLMSLERQSNGNLDGLADLDAISLAALRDIYFKRMDKHLEQEKRSAIVIDKLPTNISHAGLIHRVFPNARFVFALRHPCDCVLSCYMQSFKLHDFTANFQDLEDAARLYDQTMSLWEQYRAILPLRVHTVRYEDLVMDFEKTVKPLLDFLEVDWDDSVHEYAQTARKRGRISTPSYDKVTEGLYTRAQGRWERYREHMEPILPILLPWAERYGYEI